MDTFKSITPLLGGFHELMTDQKILYVKHVCIGFDKWFSSSGILKSELAAEKAFSGRHNSGIRVLKESFDAMIQPQFVLFSIILVTESRRSRYRISPFNESDPSIRI